MLPSEATGWAAFFAREETDGHGRADYALAIVAREVHLLRNVVQRLLYGSDAPEPVVELEKFLVRYSDKHEKKVELPPMTPEEVAKKKKEVSGRMASYWKARIGVLSGKAGKKKPLPARVVIATAKHKERSGA